MMKFTSWDQEYSYEETIHALELIQDIVAPPTSRSGILDFPWGAPAQILDYEFDYHNLSVDHAICLRQVQGLYKKLEPLRLPDVGDREKAAYWRFLGSEIMCKNTNLLFRKRAAGELYFRPAVEETLLRAQRKIAAVLGEVPSMETLKLHFGPGGTTNVSKKNASAPAKLEAPLACGEPLVPYLSEILHELPCFCRFPNDEGVVTVEVHPGRLQFVPKNAKAYRTIVVEPMLSGLYQLGIGEYMFQRLRRIGLDLRDQSVNQRLARKGSLTGGLATLDLSNASDLVSSELVSFLLPVEWYMALRKGRSSTVEYHGATHRLEKFSSMGNGFTFPLESLIFYALSWASCPGGSTVRAYGDDIIVPTEHVPFVIEVLELAGFVINKSKSFWEGPFRESCGADYLHGIDIRPYHFEDLVSCESIFSFHNDLVRRGFSNEADAIRHTFLDPTMWIYGPDGYGDGHLIGRWYGSLKNRDRGWGGYTFESFKWNSRSELKVNSPSYPTYSIYVRPDGLDGLDGSLCSLNRYGDRRVSYLRMLCKKDTRTVPGLPVIRGNPRASLPGTRGYKRIKIYTFETPDVII